MGSAIGPARPGAENDQGREYGSEGRDDGLSTGNGRGGRRPRFDIGWSTRCNDCGVEDDLHRWVQLIIRNNETGNRQRTEWVVVTCKVE